MTKSEIIAALEDCNFADLKDIRDATNSWIEHAKRAFMSQAQEMGLSCSDGNEKPRKPRRTKSTGNGADHEAIDTTADAHHQEHDNG